jgi:hypothetical protein
VQQQVVLQLLQLHACGCSVQLSLCPDMLLAVAGVISIIISLQDTQFVS